jgi:hypothetical protein
LVKKNNLKIIEKFNDLSGLPRIVKVGVWLIYKY